MSWMKMDEDDAERPWLPQSVTNWSSQPGPGLTKAYGE